MLVDDQPIIHIENVCHDVTHTNSDLFALERAMANLPQVDLSTTRTIGGGMLSQQIFIPKGTTLTGQIHKKEHLNIIVSGDITVATEDGNVRIDATVKPVTIVSRAGTKRAGYAHADTVWITIHTFDESMSDDDIVTNDPKYLLDFKKE
jgi:hypothetical protein